MVIHILRRDGQCHLQLPAGNSMTCSSHQPVGLMETEANGLEGDYYTIHVIWLKYVETIMLIRNFSKCFQIFGCLHFSHSWKNQYAYHLVKLTNFNNMSTQVPCLSSLEGWNTGEEWSTDALLYTGPDVWSDLDRIDWTVLQCHVCVRQWILTIPANMYVFSMKTLWFRRLTSGFLGLYVLPPDIPVSIWRILQIREKYFWCFSI